MMCRYANKKKGRIGIGTLAYWHIGILNDYQIILSPLFFKLKYDDKVKQSYKRFKCRNRDGS